MMLETIKNLYKFNRCLLGEGYDNALEYLKHLLKLEIIEVSSGTKVGSWTVPQEWIIKDAWVKFKGKKIIDYKKEPLSLVVNSIPFKGEVNLEEFKKHLHISDKMPDAIPYEYLYYKEDWGFCMPKNKVLEIVDIGCKGGKCEPNLKKIDSEVGKVRIEGLDNKPILKDKLKEGKYEIFIDTEFVDNNLKIGVHTIKGKTDREILLIAHLDHPYQADDNLSGVACLVDLAHRIKKTKEYDHTIKIIFCPETIGSIAYAFTQDISKVDFVIAVDAVGSDNSLLFQKAFDKEAKINFAGLFALRELGIDHRVGDFRFLIGSDEYVFNDPKIGIPGIMISRWPYSEYHTSDDKLSIIKKEKLIEIQDFILKTIDIYEKDYIPKLNFKGPLFRTLIDAETTNKNFNLEIDYFIYNIDGKKSIIDILRRSAINWDYAYDLLEKMKKKNLCE